MTLTKLLLVVEDEPSIQTFLCEVLTAEGYQVRTASNGQEAWGYLSEMPALVLSDVMMPRLDGCGLCRQMQAHATYRHIPVVLMSALGEKPGPVHECPHTAFFRKPLDIIALLDLIARLTA